MTWQSKPLRRIFRIVNGGTPTSEDDNWDGDVPWATPVDIGSVDGSYLTKTQRSLTEKGVQVGSSTISAGSLVLSTRAPIGYVAEVLGRTAFNQGCRGLVPLEDVDSRYFRYQMLALRSELVSRGAGSTFMELSSDELAATLAISPPIEEQVRVANFLDAETRRLDTMTSARGLQAANRVEALQSEAARLTGRDRRSCIPHRWQKVALRRVVQRVRTGSTPTGLLHPRPDVDGMPWYTPAALQGTLSLADADRCVDLSDRRHVPRFSSGSVLVVGIGESLGKVADLTHEATGNQQLTAIKTNDSVDRRFVAWQLFAAYEEIREWAQYSRIRILNNENLLAFPVMIPSVSAQIVAREELDGRLADLTSVRSAERRFKSLAAERRQALITAAVNGRIDVTTARGADV